MDISTGILYSACDLLSLVDENEIDVKNFQRSFKTFKLAAADVVLQISQDCSWIRISESGKIYVTDKGNVLLNASQRQGALRQQLFDVIEFYQPTWAAKLHSGRDEVTRFLPKNVKECLDDAGLFEEWTDELIENWDELSRAAHQIRSKANLEVGRRAEKLTMEYELNRTSKEPRWQALNSNFSGYDVLSVVSDQDESLLKIEVKGSSQKKNSARLYISINEWRTALNSNNYVFYLWTFAGPEPHLDIVTVDTLKSHIPRNQNSGKWQNVEIPFSKLTS